MPHSTEAIWKRMERQGLATGPADSLGDHLDGDDLAWISHNAANACDLLLNALVIDQGGPHTAATAKRMGRMWVEAMWGRFTPRPLLTAFPSETDQLYTVGPITVRSMCAHHMLPVIGSVQIGILPGKTILGLSKFTRLAQWVFARPTVQEDATRHLAGEIEAACQPAGLAVVARCRHMCCEWRGVKDATQMTTSDMRGVLREDATARAEFLSLIRGPICE